MTRLASIHVENSVQLFGRNEPICVHSTVYNCSDLLRCRRSSLSQEALPGGYGLKVGLSRMPVSCGGATATSTRHGTSPPGFGVPTIQESPVPWTGPQWRQPRHPADGVKSQSGSSGLSPAHST